MEARLVLPRHTASGRFCIEGISSVLELRGKRNISSGPIIRVAGELFAIGLFPKEHKSSKPGFVTAYVARVGGQFVISVELRLSLVSQAGHTMELPRIRDADFAPSFRGCWPNFVSAAELLDPSRGFVVDDVATIEASVTVFGESVINTRQCGLQAIPPPSEASLAANMAALWSSGLRSDLTLSSGDQQLRVHGLVLAARSPVFERMLASSMLEASVGTVEIPDIAPEILRPLCEFMYTDNVEGEEVWSDDEAIRGLLLAAKKYEVSGLVHLCACKALARINVQNAVAWLVLASQLSEDEFKENCLRFVVDHLSEVQDTESWGELMQNKALLPDLAPLLIQSICPPTKKRRKSK